MAVVSEVPVSTLTAEGRWEAEFYDPKFALPPLAGATWQPIGAHLTLCQYGSSAPLNEEGRGYPILRLNEIEHGLTVPPAKSVELRADQYGRLQLGPDDVLFCRTNGNIALVGRTGMVKDRSDACFASYLVRVRTDRATLAPEYLTVFLTSSLGRTQIERRAMRSNQVNVSATQLRRVPIPIPEDSDFATQIVELFNAHARAISEARRGYAEAINRIDSEVGLPLNEFLEASRPVSLGELTSSRRWDAEYQQPAGVAVRRHVTDYRGGFTRLVDLAEPVAPLRHPLAAARDEPRYIELAAVNPAVGLVDDAELLGEAELPVRARRVVAQGDVLVSGVAGSSDKTALVDAPRHGDLASTGFIQLRSSTTPAEYLVALAASVAVRTQIEREATGGILSAIPRSRLGRVVVPVLPTELIEEIVRLVREAHVAFREGLKRFDEAQRAIEALAETPGAR